MLTITDSSERGDNIIEANKLHNRAVNEFCMLSVNICSTYICLAKILQVVQVLVSYVFDTSTNGFVRERTGENVGMAHSWRHISGEEELVEIV